MAKMTVDYFVNDLSDKTGIKAGVDYSTDQIPDLIKTVLGVGMQVMIFKAKGVTYDNADATWFMIDDRNFKQR